MYISTVIPIPRYQWWRKIYV